MAATSSGTGSRGDLEILSETTMLEIPRGREGREVLRVRFVRARTPEGRDVAWHDLREFYVDDGGQWRAGKRGITIRGGELRAVAAALSRALSGGGDTPRGAASSVVAESSDDIPF